MPLPEEYGDPTELPREVRNINASLGFRGRPDLAASARPEGAVEAIDEDARKRELYEAYVEYQSSGVHEDLANIGTALTSIAKSLRILSNRDPSPRRQTVGPVRRRWAYQWAMKAPKNARVGLFRSWPFALSFVWCAGQRCGLFLRVGSRATYLAAVPDDGNIHIPRDLD